MFTSLSLIKSYPIPEIDRKALLWFLSKYEQTPAGMWLKALNWRAMDFKYCWAMKNGIMGAWLSVVGDCVYLAPEYTGQDPLEYFASPLGKALNRLHPAALSNWAGLIASVAVHELRHKCQRKRLGFALYALCTLPGVRQVTLEWDANRIAKPSDEFFKAYVAALDMNEFYARYDQKAE